MAYESLKIKLIYNSFAAPKKDKTLVRLICMEYVILKSSILQFLFQAFKKIVSLSCITQRVLGSHARIQGRIYT